MKNEKPIYEGGIRRKGSVKLFALTFVSTLLLALGLITVGLMVTPVVINLLDDPEAYKPQLPISEVRIDDYLDAQEDTAVVRYPALTQLDTVESGDWIRIPSIDVNVPLELSPSLRDEDVLKTLAFGAALYPNGVDPGELGNTFISAHSTGEPWKGKYRFAFLRIGELEDGNVIHIDRNGTRYTYKMVKKEIVTPTPEFRVQSDRPVPTMTLMACWPLWSTQKRMLLHTELTNVTQLTERPVS